MGMTKTVHAEIRIPEPEARRIIAKVANEWFGTDFKPEHVRVMYSGGYDESEFDGFAIVFEEVIEKKGEK